MYRYIATFPSGAVEIVIEMLRGKIPSTIIEDKFENLIIFRCDFRIHSNEKLPFFSNVFSLVTKFGSKNMQSFEKIADWVITRPTFMHQLQQYIKETKGKKYRIYFTEDVSTSSYRDLLTQFKDLISVTTNLEYSATEAEFEIWFFKRSEGLSFIGIKSIMIDSKKTQLMKGELRPEVATILCYLAEPKSSDVILDPFCGYGSIPICMSKYSNTHKIIASDLDIRMISNVIAIRNINKGSIVIQTSDGFRLKNINDNSIDKIITDPPWGLFNSLENIEEKYSEMLTTFKRILKLNGKIVLLIKAAEIIHKVVPKLGFRIEKSYNINIGGQMANIFKLEMA